MKHTISKRCILTVYLMINRPKTLIIVEGGRLEPSFFKQMQKAFDLNFDIYCLENNIYHLYNKLKEFNFNANIKDVLLETHNTEEYRKLLSQNFAYTYLIFDFDPHHTEEYEKSIPLENIIVNNIVKVCEMAEYFIDETDPTIGKLYINYPMMESFKDCDSFNDEQYLSRMVNLNDIKRYKQIVGSRKMANRRVDSYSKNDFTQLTLQNMKKLEKICKVFPETIDYETYLHKSVQANILKCEKEFIEFQKQIAVLNSSVFLVLDYYGNKDGFFDSIINNK